MSCSFYQHLSPSIDGELDTPTTEKLKNHLETCVFCRAELNFMLQIRNSLRQGATSTKAPLFLKDKILGEARRAQRTFFFPRWNFAHAAGLVVVVLLAFVMLFNFWPKDRHSFTDIADILAKHHTVYGPGGKSLSIGSSDSQDAQLWFKTKLGLEFSVPNAAFAGYKLKGANAFEHQGTKFAYLKYQKNEKIIGYIIFKDKGFSLDLPETVDIGKIKLEIGKNKETNIAVWKKGGLVYLILTTENRSELLEYARRCIQLF
jgi:anti-sigma factor RsiW